MDGGKDSTLTLYFINQVAEKYGYEKPTAVFIDHYQHFDEIIDFVEDWANEWDIDLVFARNEDIGSYADEHDLDRATIFRFLPSLITTNTTFGRSLSARRTPFRSY